MGRAALDSFIGFMIAGDPFKLSTALPNLFSDVAPTFQELFAVSNVRVNEFGSTSPVEVYASPKGQSVQDNLVVAGQVLQQVI